MLRIRERDENRVVVEASGKLDESDYRQLVPQLEHVMDIAGSLRLLVHLRDFRGWTPKGLLEELRFDLKHRKDFERAAVVGERKLEEVATELSKPIFSGEVRFFEDEASAREWLAEAA